MIEALNGKRIGDITKSLLENHNLLVKDLTDKLNGREYMRIAVRGSEDNDSIVEALKSVMG